MCSLRRRENIVMFKLLTVRPCSTRDEKFHLPSRSEGAVRSLVRSLIYILTGVD